jgi:RHS repeat-associated protein
VDPDPNTSGDEISYAHDALYRKIESTDTGSTRHWYHSAGWQVIEERDGPASTDAVVQQHVWSPVYVDAMVLRDRDTDGDGDPRDAGGGERLYVTHDANFNVTGVIGEDGSGGWEVNERYVYDPYGSRAVLDADGSADGDGASDVGLLHGHQGGRHDAAGARLVNFGFRELDTSLGRWEKQDPEGYIDGANTYLFVKSDPIGMIDPLGLFGLKGAAVGCVVGGGITKLFGGSWRDAGLACASGAVGGLTGGLLGGGVFGGAFGGGLGGAAGHAAGGAKHGYFGGGCGLVIGGIFGAIGGGVGGAIEDELGPIAGDGMGGAFGGLTGTAMYTVTCAVFMSVVMDPPALTK